jgi:phage terminase large subunit GpA-like protein
VDWNGQKIGAVRLWPVGTWDLKTEVAAALRLTEMGPDANGAWPKGAMRFPQAIDLGFFEQLTAEACVEIGSRAGFMRREWRKVRARNEQWDLAVYARALARHETASFGEAEWDALTARRLGAISGLQPDLAQLWAPSLLAEAAQAQDRAPPPAAVPLPRPPPRPRWFEPRRDFF